MMNMKKIIRSKRKTISLQVCDDATIIIKAPFGVSDEVIEKVILKHHRWLEKKKREILSQDLHFLKKEFVNEETFLYLGKTYPLKIVKSHMVDGYLVFKNNCFYLREDTGNSREAFIDWYKKEAYKKIVERVNWYAERIGFQYNQVKITYAQKRWGSCSHLNNLNFSWRLIMAPLPVLDYVVVHELVHLLKKNHSKAFWDKVRLIMPNYKKHRHWLKKHGYLLQI